MKNKVLRVVELFILIWPIIMLYSLLTDTTNANSYLIKYLLITYFVYYTFNILVYRLFWFKNYFLSPLNFIIKKRSIEIKYDLSKDIIFEKYLEIIKGTDFEVIYKNEEKGELFLCTATNLLVWKQNIYLKLIENNGETMVNIDCATINQVVSWGANKQRTDDLIQRMEEAFII